LAPRTFEYYDEAIRFLERCINSYSHLSLDEKDSKKFDENFEKGIEFCDIFEPQILSYSNFSEFLGYYYPQKVAWGRDRAKKICGATIALYKWMIKNKYMLQEEDGDAIELRESIAYPREAFEEGMEEFCNFDEREDF
jgi:hypothetical protein